MPSQCRALAVVCLLVAARAAADVPPPVGYVEACSAEKQRRHGETCVSCSTYFAEADACQKQHAARGYALRCKTRGASTWSEVWCKASTGVDVTSLKEGLDAGGPEPSDPIPTPSALASATATPPPTSTSAPSASPAPEPGVTPTPAASSPDLRGTKPAPGEKRGSCGACQVGVAWPSRMPMMLLGAALVAAWTRRRVSSARWSPSP